MVEFIDESDDRDSRLPHPNVPKNIFAVLAVWAFTLGILYFDRLQEIQTNFLVFFSLPLLFLIVFMRKESFSSILKATGLSLDTTRDKLFAVIGVVVGAFVGIGFFMFFTLQMSIVPLFFPLWISALPVGGIVVLYFAVGLFEELYVIFYAKISHNWLYDKFKIGRMNGLIVGIVIARVAWSGLHLLSYGTGNPIMFVIAWSLGMAFSFISVGLALFTSHKHLTYAAISAHIFYDIFLALYLVAAIL